MECFFQELLNISPTSHFLITFSQLLDNYFKAIHLCYTQKNMFDGHFTFKKTLTKQF